MRLNNRERLKESTTSEQMFNLIAFGKEASDKRK